MKRELQNFNSFLQEALDPTYYQETFYFTALISMTKDTGGSRDETKNDIRALSEVLTVTLVEKEKGGVQKDLGTKYLSTLKVHLRKPKDISKEVMMKRTVKMISRLKGVSVLRYKEKVPTPRRKAFHGPGSYTRRVQNVNEVDYQKVRRQKAGEYAKDKAEYISTGTQKEGGAPFNRPASKKRGPSAPGPFGAMGEGIIDEAMKTAADLPEGVVVVVLKESDGTGFQVYYAERDKPNVRLKAGDLDRMEGGLDIFGTLHVGRGGNEPYEGVYVITSAKAKDGFGPLLYDVALEVAGEDGLKPDVEDVSDDASAVWKHYDTQREDVLGTALVPDDDQDAYSLVMPYDRAEHPEANQHLAKAYFKKGNTVTQELIDQDKFIELKPDTQIPTPSAREELADLAGELSIPIVKNKDMSRFDRLYEEVLITLGSSTDDLFAFDVRPELNQKIWDGEKEVRPGVKGALMDIVDEFLEGLDMDLDIKDVIITGSIANYNWSKFSDIDIHILVDFEDVNDNTEMVKKFFDAVKSNWNKLHNIMVKGHEVEIYVQHATEPHVSTGVYSLMNDRWLVKPKKVRPAIDRGTASKKMKHLAREIGKISSVQDAGNYEESFALATKIKEKIKKMRQRGLEDSGIYSPENLAFKMLRRSGDIEQLFAIYTAAYDKLYSLDQ
jgi:predicted nucleotidyltransferase